jgi:DNA polymerase
MRGLTLDFETYYDADCTLRKLTVPEYVAHPDFAVHVLSAMFDDDEPVLLEPHEIQDFFDNVGEVRLIAQNIAFDGYICAVLYGFIPAQYVCTKAMMRAVHSNARADLKTGLERLFPDDPAMRKGDELVLSKGVRDLKTAMIWDQMAPKQRKLFANNQSTLQKTSVFDALASYCKLDSWLCRQLFLRLEALFPDSQYFFMDQLARAQCQSRIRLDRDILLKVRDDSVEETEALIAASFMTRETLASNPKFIAALNGLELNPPTKISPTTQLPIPALGKADPEYIEFCEEHPEFNHIWEARMAVKSRINETRAERLINIGMSTGGVLPVELILSGAHTHRLSGGGKINLQNLPRGGSIRAAIIPQDGYVFVIRDSAQIEARGVAWAANEEGLLKVFRERGDPYSYMATKVFHYEVKKGMDERGIGKVIVLGLGYRMGAKKFHKVLAGGPLGMAPINVPLSTAYEWVSIYRSENAAIEAFWFLMDEIIMAMANPRCDCWAAGVHFTFETATLPSGLQIRYEGLHYDSGFGSWRYKSAMGWKFMHGGVLTENIIQALAQEIIKWQWQQGVIRAQDEKLDVVFSLQIHDELVFSAKIEHAERFNEILTVAMDEVPEWALGWPVTSEGKITYKYEK